MEILQNQEALQAAVERHQLVIVQYGAENCPPCKALQHKIRTWNQTHPDIFHIYVNVTDFPQVCAQMGVFTVPTIFVYAAGKPALQQSGCFSLDQMLQQIEKYQRLLES